MPTYEEVEDAEIIPEDNEQDTINETQEEPSEGVTETQESTTGPEENSSEESGEETNPPSERIGEADPANIPPYAEEVEIITTTSEPTPEEPPPIEEIYTPSPEIASIIVEQEHNYETLEERPPVVVQQEDNIISAKRKRFSQNNISDIIVPMRPEKERVSVSPITPSQDQLPQEDRLIDARKKFRHIRQQRTIENLTQEKLYNGPVCVLLSEGEKSSLIERIKSDQALFDTLDDKIVEANKENNEDPRNAFTSDVILKDITIDTTIKDGEIKITKLYATFFSQDNVVSPVCQYTVDYTDILE
jgi:hypothetical protein